jgi:hypothetical protein
MLGHLVSSGMLATGKHLYFKFAALCNTPRGRHFLYHNPYLDAMQEKILDRGGQFCYNQSILGKRGNMVK